MSRLRRLQVALWAGGIAELAYFTASHWFFHRTFFNTLGIRGTDLESPFVISQLQLIGAMVMGYAGLNFIVASDPFRYRAMLALILLVGSICVTIFVSSVSMGTLPPRFLINAAIVLAQVVSIAVLFPRKPEGGLS